MPRFAVFGFLALSVVGCSDPAPPVAQGQSHYRVKSPSDPPVDTSCTSTATAGIGATDPLTVGGDTGVPDLPPATGEPQDAGGPVADGQLAPDGTTKYAVKCTMSGTDSVQFSFSMEGPNSVQTGSVGQTSLDAMGTLDAKTGTGTGEASFFTTDVFDVTPVQNVPCNFTVVTDLSNGQKQLNAEKGSVWMTFQCPGVVLGGADGSYCASEGTIVAQNCYIKN